MVTVQGEPREFRQRSVAVKCKIADLLQGRFIRGENRESSFVDTVRGQISRVNIIAVVIGKMDDSIVVDDGSGRIRIVGFENASLYQDKDIGDILLIIGKPRMFQTDIYCYPEIIKKIHAGWIAFRKKELDVILPLSGKVQALQQPVKGEPSIRPETKTTVPKESSAAVTPKLTVQEELIQLVKQLDKGDGVDTSDIIASLNGKGAEEHIQRLIMIGELYEVKRGRIKVLE